MWSAPRTALQNETSPRQYHLHLFYHLQTLCSSETFSTQETKLFSALEQLVGGSYPPEGGEAASSLTGPSYVTCPDDGDGDYCDDPALFADGMSMRLLCITSELLFVLPGRDSSTRRREASRSAAQSRDGRNANLDCFSKKSTTSRSCWWVFSFSKTL